MENTVSLNDLSTVIQFGDEMLNSYLENKGMGMDITNLVVVGLYRKCIELTDSIYVLADHGLLGPASTCYRSLIEAVLGITYIINDKQFTKHRAYAYYVGANIQTKIDLTASLSKDDLTSEDRTKIQEELNIVINNLNATDSDVQSTLGEWNTTKRNLRIRYEPKWHSLYNGPKTIIALAKYMQNNDTFLQLLKSNSESYNDIYEVMYSILSREAHGYDVLNTFDSPDPNNRKLLNLKPIRTSTQEVLYGQFKLGGAGGFLLHVTSMFVKNLYSEFSSRLLEYSQNVINKD